MTFCEIRRSNSVEISTCKSKQSYCENVPREGSKLRYALAAVVNHPADRQNKIYQVNSIFHQHFRISNSIQIPEYKIWWSFSSIIIFFVRQALPVGEPVVCAAVVTVANRPSDRQNKTYQVNSIFHQHFRISNSIQIPEYKIWEVSLLLSYFLYEKPYLWASQWCVQR